MTKYEENQSILNWFTGRVGDHLPNEAYQKLLPELANIITGSNYFDSVEDVIIYIQRESPYES